MTAKQFFEHMDYDVYMMYDSNGVMRMMEAYAAHKIEEYKKEFRMEKMCMCNKNTEMLTNGKCKSCGLGHWDS